MVGGGEVPIVLLDEQSQQFQITMTHSVLVEQRKLVGCFRMVSCFRVNVHVESEHVGGGNLEIL